MLVRCKARGLEGGAQNLRLGRRRAYMTRFPSAAEAGAPSSAQVSVAKSMRMKKRILSYLSLIRIFRLVRLFRIGRLIEFFPILEQQLTVMVRIAKAVTKNYWFGATV